MLREIAVLTQLEAHPAIVHLLDAYETDQQFYLVLELCSGGELFEAITKQVRCCSSRTQLHMPPLLPVAFRGLCSNLQCQSSKICAI